MSGAPERPLTEADRVYMARLLRERLRASGRPLDDVPSSRSVGLIEDELESAEDGVDALEE